jgi:hypothetical protein
MVFLKDVKKNHNVYLNLKNVSCVLDEGGYGVVIVFVGGEHLKHTFPNLEDKAYFIERVSSEFRI